MPHQFEVVTATDILYFMTSGVLDKSGSFVDLQRQSGPECWDHTMRRLASMYHTQTPFNLKSENDIFKAVHKLKQEFLDIGLWKLYSEFIIHDLFHLCNNDPMIAQVMLKQFKTLAQLVIFIGEEFTKSMLTQPEYSQQFFKRIKCCRAKSDLFLADCNQLLANILQLKTREHKYVVQMFTEYYAPRMCELFDNSLQPGSYIHDHIPEEIRQDAALTFLKNHLNPTYKSCKYKDLLSEYSRVTLGLEIRSFSTACNIKQSLYANIRYFGAFVVEGFVGRACYTKPPKKIATFGSVDLLGFPANSYNQDIDLTDGTQLKLAHSVIVIGMYQGKVVYQDPACDSPANGPRTAFVMDADKFIERVAIFYQINGHSNIAFITLNPDRVDATEALMLQQTRPVGEKQHTRMLSPKMS